MNTISTTLLLKDDMNLFKKMAALTDMHFGRALGSIIANQDNLNFLDWFIEEAKILYGHEKYARAYFLGYTANEEISKGQIIADFIMGVCSEKELLYCFKKHDLKSSYTNNPFRV